MDTDQIQNEILAGQYDTALQELETPTATESKDPAVHLLHGDVLRCLKRFQEAVEWYSVALTLRPGWDKALLARASCYAEMYDGMDLALADVNALASAAPKDSRWHEEAAGILESFAKWNRAAEEWHRAIRITSTVRAELHVRRAYCLQQAYLTDAKHQEEIIAEADAAILLDQNCIEAWRIRYHALECLEDTDAARLVTAKRLVSLDAQVIEFRIALLKELAESGEPDEVISYATEFIKQFPDDYSASYLIRGDALQESGSFKEAVDDYNEGLRRSPEIASRYLYYLDRAKCYSMMGDAEAAIADCDAALKDNQGPWTYFARARCHARAGNWTLALNDLDSAQAKHSTASNVREFLVLRSECYDQLGEKSKARDLRAQIDTVTTPNDE